MNVVVVVVGVFVVLLVLLFGVVLSWPGLWCLCFLFGWLLLRLWAMVPKVATRGRVSKQWQTQCIFRTTHLQNVPVPGPAVSENGRARAKHRELSSATIA